jgi:hypothetical protein
MQVPEYVFFRYFFTFFAVTGAVAEWTLACWFGLRPPLAFHLLGPAALATANRLSARALRREASVLTLFDRVQRAIFAAAFVALAGVAALVVTVGVPLILGGFRAEAGVVGARQASTVFGGPLWLLGSVAAIIAAGTVVHGYVRGHRRLVVTATTVELPDLPPALDGLRVVHVSDLHLGPLADRAALCAAFDRVTALDPDVVCVTGDIVDTPFTDLASWLPELDRVRARHGVFAILGNHDRHVGPDAVAAAMARWTHWRLLRDEVATVDVAGARLHIAGLENRSRPESTEDLPALLAAVPAGEPSILLVHNPEAFPAAIGVGARLVLAGHTHGGQLAVPILPRLNPARIFLTPYDAGRFTRDGATLLVSRGLGHSGQPVRVGVPAEICVVTLVRSVARAA